MLTIEGAMTRLGAAPHQGTLCEDVVLRLRRVTKDKVPCFLADDELAESRVLVVFFTGRDHLRHVVERLGPRVAAKRPGPE